MDYLPPSYTFPPALWRRRREGPKIFRGEVCKNDATAEQMDGIMDTAFVAVRLGDPLWLIL